MPDIRCVSFHLVLTVALALCLQGCTREPATMFADAQKSHAKGDAESAAVDLKALLQEAPDHGGARLLLGKILAAAGDAPGAEAELRRAQQAGLQDDEVPQRIAQVMVAQGKWPSVIAEFGGTRLKTADADAVLRALVAEAHAKSGAIDEAEPIVRAALRDHPNNATVRLAAAKLEAVRHGPKAGLTLVDQLLATDAGNGPAWALKGDLLQQTEGLSTATVDAYTRALALQPALVNAHFALVAQAMSNRQWDLAQQRWAVMKRALPNHVLTAYQEALIAQKTGKLHRARELLQALLKAQRDNFRFLLAAGEVELQLNALAQAEALFAKANQLQPQEKPARRLLAQVQLRSGKPERALDTIKPLLVVPSPDAADMVLAAQANLQAGNRDAANKLFAQSLAAHPGNPGAQLAAAAPKLAKGWDPEAYRALQAVAKNDASTQVDLLLVNTLISIGKLSEASAAIDEYARKEPQSPVPPQARGRIALIGADVAGARKHFEDSLAKDAQYFPAAFGLANIDLGVGDIDLAKKRFERVLELNPGHALSLQALGDIHAASGQLAEATDYLERAVALAPTDATLRLRLIDFYRQSGNTDKALASAQSAFTAVPGNDAVQGRLADGLLAAKQYQQAGTHFARLAQLQPKSVDAHVGLVVSRVLAGSERAGVEVLYRGVEQSGDAGALMDGIAVRLLAAKRMASAVRLAKALQVKPAHLGVGLIVEGDLAMAEGKPAQALVSYQRALKTTAGNLAALRVHASQIVAGNTSGASTFADDWVKAHPNDLQFLQHLADRELAAGNFAAAEARYRKIVQTQPSHWMVLNNLAHAVLRQQKQGAVEVAERAVALAPMQPNVLDTYATTLDAVGKVDKARTVQAKAVMLAPRDPALRLKLVRYKLKLGEADGAKHMLLGMSKLRLSAAQQAELEMLQRGIK